MLKPLHFIVFLLLIGGIHSQTTIDFENQVQNVDTFDNSQDGSGDFEIGKITFPNNYDFQNDFWAGQWAMSSSLDSTTPSFNNLYGSVAGKGYMESNVYAIGQKPFNGDPLHIAIDGMIVPQSVYINNTAYAYFTIKDGNQFAKAFGGPSGEDPDYFFIRWKGFLDGELQGSKDFYLADYRFQNSSEDYIIKEWTAFSLTELGMVDSIGIEYYSSDTGQFGINTPLFFAIDNFSYENTSQISQEESSKMKIYPNPAQNELRYIRNVQISDIKIYGLNGQSYSVHSKDNRVDIRHLPKGTYIMQWRNQHLLGAKCFIKQ